MIWNGIDVSIWGPIQTAALRKKRLPRRMHMYTGYESIYAQGIQDILELIEEIPLDIRYQDFRQRLGAAQERRYAKA